MSAEKEGPAEVLAGLAIMLIWIPCACLLYGWTLSTLWNWWIPTTTALPEITLRAGVGILIVKSYVFAKVPPTDDEPVLLTAIKHVIHGIVISLYLLAIGWAAQAVAF